MFHSSGVLRRLESCIYDRKRPPINGVEESVVGYYLNAWEISHDIFKDVKRAFFLELKDNT